MTISEEKSSYIQKMAARDFFSKWPPFKGSASEHETTTTSACSRLVNRPGSCGMTTDHCTEQPENSVYRTACAKWQLPHWRSLHSSSRPDALPLTKMNISGPTKDKELRFWWANCGKTNFAWYIYLKNGPYVFVVVEGTWSSPNPCFIIKESLAVDYTNKQLVALSMHTYKIIFFHANSIIFSIKICQYTITPPGIHKFKVIQKS